MRNVVAALAFKALHFKVGGWGVGIKGGQRGERGASDARPVKHVISRYFKVRGCGVGLNYSKGGGGAGEGRGLEGWGQRGGGGGGGGAAAGVWAWSKFMKPSNWVLPRHARS